MTKGLVNSKVLVRKNLILDGVDAERSNMYSRGYAILTTDQDGNAIYVHVLTNSSTFSDNLCRQVNGEKYVGTQLVADYDRDAENEAEQNNNGSSEKKPIKKKAKAKA